MNCDSCGAAASDGARFCGQCGKVLAARCESCAHPLVEGARFCSQCGVAVTGVAKPPARVARTEQRQLTTLFCDLVGSTQLASRIDAEDLRDVLNRYQLTCLEVLRNHDGYLAQYLGDGLLCYFGYPAASEHDAENSARAGLAMIEAVSALELEVDSEPLQLEVRVGIHTGPVVVGEVGSGERKETLAVGATTNLAARLQAAAEPNTVLISEQTHQLLRGRLTTLALGAREFVGVRSAVRVFRVVGGQESSANEVSPVRLSPFTGRAADLAILVDRARKAQGGFGQCVLVAGEPGIGKSRLVRGLRDELVGQSVGWLECRAEHLTHARPLAPVVVLIESNLGLTTITDEAQRRRLLVQGLEMVGMSAPEDVALVAQLLNLANEEEIALIANLQGDVRARLVDALARWIIALSGARPIVLVVEDLQWLDANSASWVSRIAELVHNQRVLLIVTQRPQPVPRWVEQPNALLLSLSALDPQEARALVERLASRRRLTGEDMVAAIVDRADGNPLFIEELVQNLQQNVAQAVGLVPMSLQDLLMARLDAVGEAKTTAQLGACLGRQFEFDLLSAVSSDEQSTLREHIDRLVEAGLLYRRRADTETYLFKHALTRDTAYQSLVRSERRQRHQQIADLLCSDAFEERVAPEVIAHHYTCAQNYPRAVEYLVRAGEKERAQHAIVEAEVHYQSALDMLLEMPPGKARDAQELPIRMALGRLLMATAGYSAAEVEANALRVGELCDDLGDEPSVFPALFEQWSVAMGQEDGARMLGFAERLLGHAQRINDAGLMVETELAMAATRRVLGEPASSVEHAQRSIGFYDFERDRAHVHMFGQDPCVMSFALGGLALAVMGRLDEALRWADDGLQLAVRTEHPYTLVCAHAFRAPVCNLRGDWLEALQAADAQHRLSLEGGFALYEAGALGHRATALNGLARHEEAAAAAEASAQGYVAANALTGSMTPLIALAEAQLALGQLDACEQALQRADELQARGVTPYKWPDLASVHAGLRVARDGELSEAATALYTEAIATALGQGALLTALTSASAFAQALLTAGRHTEAAQLLDTHLSAIAVTGGEAPIITAARHLLSRAGS